MTALRKFVDDVVDSFINGEQSFVDASQSVDLGDLGLSNSLESKVDAGYVAVAVTWLKGKFVGHLSFHFLGVRADESIAERCGRATWEKCSPLPSPICESENDDD